MSRKTPLRCTVCGTPISRGQTCSPACRKQLSRRRKIASKCDTSAGGSTGTLPLSDLASKPVTLSKLITKFAPFSACARCGLATNIRLATPELCLPGGDPGEYDYQTPCYHAACAPTDKERPAWHRRGGREA